MLNSLNGVTCKILLAMQNSQTIWYNITTYDILLTCFKTAYVYVWHTQNKCCAKFLIPHMSSLTKPCHLIQLDTVTECSHLWKNNPHSDWPAERPSAVWLAKGGESQRLGTRTKGWRDSISEVILSACFPASCFPAPHPALRFLFLSVSHL